MCIRNSSMYSATWTSAPTHYIHSEKSTGDAQELLKALHTLPDKRYSKSGSPKIVKLATHAITLKNWFKRPLSTLTVKLDLGKYFHIRESYAKHCTISTVCWCQACFDQSFTTLFSNPQPYLTAVVTTTWIRTLKFIIKIASLLGGCAI